MTYIETLKKLGITPNYIGFRQTALAIEFVHERPEWLLLVTKCLYPAVAKECGTSWKAVERHIRFVITIAWERNPELLDHLAGYPLCKKPKAAQFIAILAEET